VVYVASTRDPLGVPIALPADVAAHAADAALAVPADNGVGFHEQDGVRQAPEAAGQGTEEPPIEAAPPRSFGLSADDNELLAKEQVLGDQHCPGCEDGQDNIEQEAKEDDHGPERLPRWSIRGTVERPWRAGGRVRGQVEDWRRDGHVTVGETGSGPAHVRSICAPQVCSTC